MGLAAIGRQPIDLQALRQMLRKRFKGWRVGLIATDARPARASALPFLPAGAPVAHGGLRVKLYRTDTFR